MNVTLKDRLENMKDCVRILRTKFLSDNRKLSFEKTKFSLKKIGNFPLRPKENSLFLKENLVFSKDNFLLSLRNFVRKILIIEKIFFYCT